MQSSDGFWYNVRVNMNIQLAAADIAVLGLYAALLLGVGLFMGRKVKNAGDFFSGGALFGTSKRERESREELFASLQLQLKTPTKKHDRV
jgi:hypothetical protein